MYKLEDFKPKYPLWYMLHEEKKYYLEKSYDGYRFYVAESTYSQLKLVSKTTSLHQAKMHVNLKYGIPLTGWQASHSQWGSQDGRWRLIKNPHVSSSWAVHNKNVSISPEFPTRSEAIEWINQQEVK